MDDARRPRPRDQHDPARDADDQRDLPAPRRPRDPGRPGRPDERRPDRARPRRRWFGQEHTAYGIPFPDTRERFERYAEQLDLITGLWTTPVGERFAFDGTHYQLADSPALPKPVQDGGHRGGVPVLVGGLGKKQTPALAAAYADEFNLPFVDEETTAAQFARVRRAAEDIGRDPASLTWSNALVLCVGEDEAAIARRAAVIGREVDELRVNGLAGTPAEVVDKIKRYEALGAQRIYLQTLDLADLDHLRLVAAEVMPHV